MAKSSARKTADAIHNIPEYFGPQVDEPTDGMKKGDIWFESDGTRREAPQSKPLPSMQNTIDKRKKDKAERPLVKIPKLKKKRSL